MEGTPSSTSSSSSMIVFFARHVGADARLLPCLIDTDDREVVDPFFNQDDYDGLECPAFIEAAPSLDAPI